MQPLELQMLGEFDQKVAHGLRGHDARPALGESEAGQVDGDHRVGMGEVGQDPPIAVEALRPGTGEQDGYPIRPTASDDANAQAVDHLGGDAPDVRKVVGNVAHAGFRNYLRSCSSAVIQFSMW